MSIVIFVIILVILIVSHEFGHFIVAKKSGIRVDEFGIGFPPRIWGKKFGETLYSINWLPLGGFVRIFGEDNETPMTPEEEAGSFVRKPKIIQAGVLVAGIVFNLILAWLIFSFVLAIGMPTSVSIIPVEKLKSVSLIVYSVEPGSPAEQSGLTSGDKISYLKSGMDELKNPTPEMLQKFVADHSTSEIIFGYLRNNNSDVSEVSILPALGVYGDSPAIGIALDMVGVYKTSIIRAPIESLSFTWRVTSATFMGYVSIIKSLFVGQGREVLAMVSGPVGIAGLVGTVASSGFVPLLVLTAIISISLAVLNLIPFPALDGGRLFFLLIEIIKGSPIKPKVAAITNTIGFVLLILLLLVVTYSDITKLFH